MGHEMSGTVTEVGFSVTQLKLGDKVAINPSLDDRSYNEEVCEVCSAGRPNICKRWACFGLNADGGGFAEEIVVRPFNCIRLPEGVSLKSGALAEPLSVASHMIRLSGFSKGQHVVVLGAGPIGLALLLLLKAWGAAKIVVSEVTESRSTQAKQLGADIVVDPTKQGSGEGDPVVAAIKSLSPLGADIAFDATGLQATLDTAIAATRPGGVVFNVAIHEKPLSLNLNDIALTEKKLMGGICYTNGDYEAVLDLIASGAIDAETLITSVVPLENVVEGGFLELINNKASHVKILIQPGAA